MPEATAAAPIADIGDHPGEPDSSVSADVFYWDVASTHYIDGADRFAV